jgi:hypothetical protein
MRLLLVAWLIIAMAPGLGEIVETVVDGVTFGHVVHCEDPCHQGDDRGCDEAQCLGSCSCQAVTLTSRFGEAGTMVLVPSLVPADELLAPLHEPAPLRRPPIPS